MKTEFHAAYKRLYKVGLSFEVWIDLDDFDGEEITEQDIQNAFGSVDPVSDAGVKHYIKEHLTPEDIFEHGNIQAGGVTYVCE